MTQYRQRLDAGHYQGNAGVDIVDGTNGTYACPNCERTFTTEAGLRIHTTKAHTQDTPPDQPTPDSE